MTKKITTLKQALEALEKAKARNREHMRVVRERDSEIVAMREESDIAATIHQYITQARSEGHTSDAKIVDTLLKAFATGDWYIIPKPQA